MPATLESGTMSTEPITHEVNKLTKERTLLTLLRASCSWPICPRDVLLTPSWVRAAAFLAVAQLPLLKLMQHTSSEMLVTLHTAAQRRIRAHVSPQELKI